VECRHRPLHLAGTPPLTTGRSVAASAYPAQLPLHRAGNAGPRRGVARSAFRLRAFRGAYGDIIAAILALLSLASLPSRAGFVVAWIFNLW
jgi:hypothetical protein